MGLRRNYLDHRQVGTAFLVLAIVAGMTGGAMALALRAGKLHGSHLVALDVPHGVLMLFFTIFPALVGGFGNWFVPVLIGSETTALPRVNGGSLALLALAFLMVVAGLVLPAGASIAVTGLLVWCLGAVLGAVVTIATILNMRNRDIGLGALPLFVWAQLYTALMLVVAAPVLCAGLTHLLVAGNPEGLGALLRQFSYPETAIALIPAFGMVSHIIEAFAGGTIARSNVVGGAMGVMAAGALVWVRVFARHIDITGSSALGLSCLQVGPCLVVIAVWARTLWSGKIRMTVPMMWAAGFLVLLSAGWALQLLPDRTDIHSAAQFGAIAALFGGFYFWVGKMYGGQYPKSLAIVHFWLTAGGIACALAPHSFHVQVAGSALMAAALAVFGVVFAVAFARRGKLPANYWGDEINSAEWHLPSPLPAHGNSGMHS